MPARSHGSIVIWMLNHYVHPRDVHGGSRQSDLGAELVRRGNQVVTFPSSFDHFSHKYGKLAHSARRPIECVVEHSVVWKLAPMSAEEMQHIALNANRARHQLRWDPTVKQENGLTQVLTRVETLVPRKKTW